MRAGTHSQTADKLESKDRVTDTCTERLTPSEWALDFQTRFEAICRRFWASLEVKQRPLKSPAGGTTANSPTTRLSHRAHSPKEQRTRAQLRTPQTGPRATWGVNLTRHPHRRKKTGRKLQHRSGTLGNHIRRQTSRTHKQSAAEGKRRNPPSPHGAHSNNPPKKLEDPTGQRAQGSRHPASRQPHSGETPHTHSTTLHLAMDCAQE
ncbi:Hypothetical predicted protein [Pelobates cultripes]|uniref:Uncharacterized protein n=1 Tax=Pelobates cultripes TaxID=61616 RepID=A0AAD1VVB3_PELCU|nr:Hypothetical predicted protein [Pelobates cultripes]